MVAVSEVSASVHNSVIISLFVDPESPNLSNASSSTLGEPVNLPSPPEYTAVPQINKTVSDEKPRNSSTMPPPSALQPNRSSSSSAPVPPKQKPSNRRHVKALYDFSSQDDEDLSFKMGELIEVLDSSDQYGWWVGKDSKGKKGNFPSNYVMEQ